MSLNSPFKIGNLQLDNRLIQAPLAGISCAAFRELFSLYTKPAYSVTEMISANSILEHHKLAKRYLYRSANEGKLCIQLSGNNPSTLAKAVKICNNFNPDLIDLNCGCPKPKIRSKGSGSALLDNPQNLQNIVSAMRDATSLPLTVKIRTAGQTNDEQYLQAASLIAAAGADAIIIHGRHHSEDYNVPANYTQIKRITQEVTIPVIANGDIQCSISAELAINSTNAQALMIGRGTIGKPWLIENLLGNPCKPQGLEILNIFAKHLSSLIELENSEAKAIMQARRLIKWYFPKFSKDQLTACYQTQSKNNLLKLLENLGCADNW